MISTNLTCLIWLLLPPSRQQPFPLPYHHFTCTSWKILLCLLTYIQPHFPSPKCTLFHSIYLGTSHRVLSPTHCLFTFLHQLLFPTYYIHPVDFPHILIHLPIISSSYLATHSYPSINIPRPSISHILYIL